MSQSTLLFVAAIVGLTISVGPYLLKMARVAAMLAGGLPRPDFATISRLGGLVVCVVCLVMAAGGRTPAPAPLPSPVPSPAPLVPVSPVDPSVMAVLESGFSGRSREAGVWAGLLKGLADAIEADGKRPTPRLKTVSDVQRLRDHLVGTVPEPVAGGDVIGRAIGPKLNEIGQQSEPLDAARRAAVVGLLRGASSSLEGLLR